MKVRGLKICAGILGGFLFGAGAPAPRLASFHGLGDLPGGEFHSEALAISADGRIVVGRSSSEHSDEEGFRWTTDAGLVALIGPSGVHVKGEPRALVTNGARIVGKIASARGPMEAAIWEAASGWTGLGDIEGGDFASQALGTSSDASCIVGWGASEAGLEAVRWVDRKALAMGDLPGGAYHSGAALVSGDGKTIVGTGTSPEGPQVFVWREGTGMVGLGDLPGGPFSSEPFGMTADAAIIVGEASSTQGIEAFRWTRETGIKGLGDLAGGEFHSIAFGVSAGGAVIVGFGTTADGSEAFLWDARQGMRSLKTVLVAAGVESVAGWHLSEATGISDDGRTVVGTGRNRAGHTEGWVARLP